MKPELPDAAHDIPSSGLPADKATVWRRTLVLALVCITLALATTSQDLHRILMVVLEAGQEIIQRHPVSGALLFVVFAALSAMLAFVSAAVIVPVAAFTWGVPVAMLLLWVGWVLGGMCTYGAGRFLGRRVVGWLTMRAMLGRLEQRIQEGLPFWMVVLLQLALPSEIPGYFLGLARYDFGRFLLALAIAELPYTAITVLLGANFIERRSATVLWLGVLLATVGIGAFYLLRKGWSARSK